MMLRKDKEGQRFGKLTITEAYKYKVGLRWFHNVVCDCGTEKSVSGGDMRRGAISSCGCSRKEKKTTHGMSKRPEYKVWASMVQRCTNKKNISYKNYGGRGIAVCGSWLIFDNFIRDMGKRKDDSLSLERIDNNLGYSKLNCVWSDRSTQSINQRVRGDNKTGYKGVSIDGRGGYVATIQRDGKRSFLGMFKSLDDAIKARLTAENNFNRLGDNNE